MFEKVKILDLVLCKNSYKVVSLGGVSAAVWTEVGGATNTTACQGAAPRGAVRYAVRASPVAVAVHRFGNCYYV